MQQLPRLQGNQENLRVWENYEKKEKKEEPFFDGTGRQLFAAGSPFGRVPIEEPIPAGLTWDGKQPGARRGRCRRPGGRR